MSIGIDVYDTEVEARSAGATVYRGRSGVAWCLCSSCTLRHSSKNKRRTKHDRWAMDGQDWRIQDDLARTA